VLFSELGDQSTISAVLYANQNHPELKLEYPSWNDRYKQIMKKWRALSAERKAPYLQRARDNRSAQQAQLRTKKAQQVRVIVSHDIKATREERSRIQINVLFLSVANWDLFLFFLRIFCCVT
jgi:HMG-box domain